MTRHLRQLLGMGHIDEHGHNVIEVNRLDAAIIATETEQERLTLELAKARGRTVQQTRWDVLGRVGSGDYAPDGVNVAPGGLQTAETGDSAHTVHRQSTEQTPGDDR